MNVGTESSTGVPVVALQASKSGPKVSWPIDKLANQQAAWPRKPVTVWRRFAFVARWAVAGYAIT
ncbi:MAG: hypothetical protein CBB71_23515 [Rhodopirellula sp. TMED11]|nr:MAG: hypothetical protein CBB71_23515 [Rhodopirellula sp. TMED11]